MTKKTYGIVVTQATQFHALVAKSQVLAKADPDEIVLLSLTPYNVQQDANWPAIEGLFRPLVGNGFSVQPVANMPAVDRLPKTMSVMV